MVSTEALAVPLVLSVALVPVVHAAVLVLMLVPAVLQLGDVSAWRGGAAGAAVLAAARLAIVRWRDGLGRGLPGPPAGVHSSGESMPGGRGVAIATDCGRGPQSPAVDISPQRCRGVARVRARGLLIV